MTVFQQWLLCLLKAIHTRNRILVEQEACSERLNRSLCAHRCWSVNSMPPTPSYRRSEGKLRLPNDPKLLHRCSPAAVFKVAFFMPNSVQTFGGLAIVIIIIFIINDAHTRRSTQQSKLTSSGAASSPTIRASCGTLHPRSAPARKCSREDRADERHPFSFLPVRSV